jgi:hypothetical protein
MTTQKYPSLKYFLDMYWNQNGDLVYGTARKAAEKFLTVENEQFRQGLLSDLHRAIEDETISPGMTWEKCQDGWWGQFDAFLNMEDASEVVKVLEHS